ncbi:M48 family metallopeptidase [Simiduia agarivorans]|uniref:YgjP-like metallopeptidase domain-containing protein n=1 Tax=Simiduia agarivorans (strain DSM 21679 / JCM 13881 / BCRC 17597 / SA1) TaxID=1117647 RepID=K4KJR4_SIMAS|nr:SprT family zinc-dependent metalloprotease [Simiduia agarivorans]AFU99394.1 hypothetical protein M5M_11085 [Simiduia agarivorans SA1 = DSM 21679]
MTPYPLTIATSARRRTLAIQVRAGQVIVRRPRGVSDAEVHALLVRKSRWIKAKLQLQAERLATEVEHSFETGDRFDWLGQAQVLTVQRGRESSLQHQPGAIHITLSSRARRDARTLVREQLLQWYADCALQWFTERAPALAARLGKRVSRVQVRVTRSKWGHCTSRAVLQFNPLIMQAPLPVIEYLLVHEVCHLREPNHSPAFWSLVAEHCPDYKASRRWLKEQGHSLFF